MITLLHVLSSDDKYGSAQCFLELLSYELQDKDITPIVVTPKLSEINKKCDESGVKNYTVFYEQVQIPKHDYAPVFLLKYIYHTIKYYRYNYTACKKIVDIVRNENVDVIHTNSCVIDVGAVVAAKTGKVNVWHLREFGRNDFNFYSVRPFIIKFMNKKNNKFIAVSDAVKKAWSKRGLSEIDMIYDGVNAKRFKVKKKLNNLCPLKAVMCGSFCEAKNQKLLVEAINLLSSDQKKNIRIDFFGACNGSYYQSVKSLIKKYQLEEIFSFQGFVTNIPERLCDYDIGILCSRSEAFGRVTVEYMMSGLCTIAPASGANLELIDEKTGILYAQLTPVELKLQLSDVIQKKINPVTLGTNARIRAMNRYDINVNAKKIIEHFKNFCNISENFIGEEIC